MTTGKTIALTRLSFVVKVMSLLFNVLSRLVITFLPRSKRLLISWLQSPSAVILEPKKIKFLTENKVFPAESNQLQTLHPRRCVQRSAFVECAIKTVFYPVDDSLRERWREIICIHHKLLWLDIDCKAVKSIRKQGCWVFFPNYGKSVSPEKDHRTQDPKDKSQCLGTQLTLYCHEGHRPEAHCSEPDSLGSWLFFNHPGRREQGRGVSAKRTRGSF